MPLRIETGYRQEFESLGLDEVRRRFQHRLWQQEKLRHAEWWIEEKEHGEDRALARESNGIARGAAKSAQTANIIACIAVAIALFAVFAPFLLGK
jgi:hypothetical protein